MIIFHLNCSEHAKAQPWLGTKSMNGKKVPTYVRRYVSFKDVLHTKVNIGYLKNRYWSSRFLPYVVSCFASMQTLRSHLQVGIGKWCTSFYKWANPGLFFVYFRCFQTNIITIFTTNISEKMSIQNTVPGFEPTTFGT